MVNIHIEVEERGEDEGDGAMAKSEVSTSASGRRQVRGKDQWLVL